MKVAVTGASGLIGSALVPALRTSGHDVVRLVRRDVRAPDEVRWDPAGGTVDLAGLAGTDAVVHLAGAGVGDHRWTDSYKETILRSRVDGTRTIVRAMTQLDPAPGVLLSGSAVGYYGDRGEEVLLEGSAKGDGFLSDVVQAWEAETLPASEAGIRTVLLRTGLVMARGGGAFGRLLPILRAGVGGPIGDGRMWWPWITLLDEVRAIEFLLDADVAGPVNLGSPSPARNGDVTRAVGRALGRPTVVPVPGFALRVVLGEFADDVTSSQRMVPEVLSEAGFDFVHADLDNAARWLVEQ
ncbi:TIGR01777 family oxidoreductase [Aquipuribacter nitratireducens]|uniref:TIGR01777 family oxidoreductase n=1 Tax=Aquipuribacter nitratireducens TaxID=650104 RepID=A0ABW0GJ13_9MICO